ncbi:MAG: ParB/RepB/Spo0J family partition protein [Lachnospirales bacterium]
MYNHTYINSEIMYLPVKKILPNPYQPRQTYDKKAMEQLTASIKRYGVLQPIAVRYINNKIYELVNGERRLNATKLAGFDTIPALVIYANDREAAAMTITENLQRKNFNYIEEAESIRILKYGFKYSNEDICHIINKDKEYIEDSLSFLAFDNEVKRLLNKYSISRQAAKDLLKLENEEKQKEIIKKINDFNLDDVSVSYLVTNAIREENKKNNTEKNHIGYYEKFKDIRLFANTLRQALSYMKSAGLETSYEINRDDENYEIKINIRG